MSQSSRRRYAALEARTTHVSEKAIRKKWAKPQDNMQLRLRQLFASVAKSAAADHATSKKASNGDVTTDLLMTEYVSYVSMTSGANDSLLQVYEKDPSHDVSSKD